MKALSRLNDGAVVGGTLPSSYVSTGKRSERGSRAAPGWSPRGHRESLPSLACDIDECFPVLCAVKGCCQFTEVLAERLALNLIPMYLAGERRGFPRASRRRQEESELSPHPVEIN